MHSIISALNQQRGGIRHRQRQLLHEEIWDSFVVQGSRVFRQFSFDCSSDEDVDEDEFYRNSQYFCEPPHPIGPMASNGSMEEEKEEQRTTATYRGSMDDDHDHSTRPIICSGDSDHQHFTLDDLLGGSGSHDYGSIWSHNTSEMATVRAVPGLRDRFSVLLLKLNKWMLRQTSQCGGRGSGDGDDDGQDDDMNNALCWMEDVQEVTPRPSLHYAAIASMAQQANNNADVVVVRDGVVAGVNVRIQEGGNNIEPAHQNPIRARANTQQALRPNRSCGTWIIRVLHQNGGDPVRFDLHQPRNGAYLILYGSEVLDPVRSIVDCMTDPNDVDFRVWTTRHGRDEQMLRVDSGSIISHLAAIMGIEAAALDNRYTLFFPKRKHHKLLRKQLLMA